MIEKHKESFTFVVVNGQVPEITVDGVKLHVVTCTYTWDTWTNDNIGASIVYASGYLEGEDKIKVFKLQFRTK